jgi:hypothetical protein
VCEMRICCSRNLRYWGIIEGGGQTYRVSDLQRTLLSLAGGGCTVLCTYSSTVPLYRPRIPCLRHFYSLSSRSSFLVYIPLSIQAKINKRLAQLQCASSTLSTPSTPSTRSSQLLVARQAPIVRAGVGWGLGSVYLDVCCIFHLVISFARTLLWLAL